MAAPDISSKKLIWHNDVFADIFDTLVFRKPYIKPGNLHDLIPEHAYEDLYGNLRSMERDVLKEYGQGSGENYFAIAEFGIDNQASIDPTIPVRVMGYDYTVYKKQLDEYSSTKRTMQQMLKNAEKETDTELAGKLKEEIRKLGEFKLVPVVTIVLNFSKTRWNKAKSLKELVPFEYPEITACMKDYPIEVIDVLYLDEETKGKFTSDFRDVVTVLSEGQINREHEFQRLKYPTDVLDMLYAYTKDEHYLDIRNQIIKREFSGEEIKMSSFYEEMDRKKVIETAIAILDETKDERMALYTIKCGLKVTMEEAKKVFDTEVAEAALA
ncbi:MAG: hypothetical protein NC306_05880 [Butyrivibrio sp.]|nr:hypothetical protein [Butyrivibrio sp.]MCM1343448.1 hypothetical protein [Muribaculaceae bacterium]